MENYEKKYKDLVEAVKILKEANPSDEGIQNWVKDIFPELNESEDEKIRKALLEMVHDTTGEELWIDYNIHKEDALAWLEKQGEQKPFDYENANIHQKDFAPNDEEMKELLRTEYEKGRADTIAEMQGEQKSLTVDIDSMVEAYEQRLLSQGGIENSPLVNMCLTAFRRGVENTLEELHLKQSEQILSNSSNNEKNEQKPTDKIEPKFKVGDWCIDNEDDTIFQIVKVLDNTYTYKTTEGKEYSCTHYSLENDVRLWSIQDAKVGDLLACPNDAGDRDVVFIFKNINSDEGWVFCFCASDANGCFCTNNDYVGNSNSTNISPATKEHRDTLERAMTNAGYRWNKEELKLEKI